ncbi:hypothetical protein ACVMGC_007666 [Bradyrhizobium barranii subsp. barranii]
MIEDPLPDLDLPERVGVLKQRVADEEKEQIGAGTNAERQQCSRATLHRNAVGKGKGHAASSSCLFLSVGA